MTERKLIDPDKLAERCAARDVDANDIIAEALTMWARENAKETGMTMRVQSDLVMKLADKLLPSQKSVEHTGDVGMTVVLQPRDADL